MSAISALLKADLTESKQPELRALLITMIILPTVVMLIRAWSRALLPADTMTRVPSRFWWDDWTAFLAAAINIVMCGINLELVHLGLGLHIISVPLQNVKTFMKLLWIVYFVHTVGMGISKASALLFYTRVFTMRNPKFKYAVWIVQALNIAWTIGTILSITFLCNPIHKVWNYTIPGTCLNYAKLWLSNCLPNLIIDVIILVLPIPMLWKLQMQTIRKIQITGVFVCGYLVIVATIGRLVTTIRANPELNMDLTYIMATPTLWLSSEIAISLISASLPSVFVLGQRARTHGLRSLLTSRTVTTGAKTNNSTHTGRSHHFDDDDDDRELVSRSRDPGFVPNTTTTAEFVGSNKSLENTRYHGIHVVSKTEVA